MKANPERIPAHVSIHQLAGTRTLAIYCGHCEGTLRLALPVAVPELMEAGRQFGMRHAACVKPEAPADARQAKLF